jgi:DNA-directed RNA polymerase specialized sigma24 family protein
MSHFAEYSADSWWDDASPLDVAQDSFLLMLRGPAPLTINGAEFGGGLPAEPIPLNELADRLMAPGVSRDAWADVWRHLIKQARTGDPQWILGCVGVAIPGLRRRAGELVRHSPNHIDSDDLDAELLTAFLDSLRSIDLDREPQPIVRLLADAYNAGRRYRRRNTHDDEIRLADPDIGATGAHNSRAEPDARGIDIAVRKAIQAGILSPAEAELIQRTRVDGVPLAQCANEKGVEYGTLKTRRWRAECRLRKALV